MGNGFNIGYVHASVMGQDTTREMEVLKQYNIRKFFEERESAKDATRPALKAMMDYVREGDTVYIESISRLAVNTLDFLNIVEELRTKEVDLVSLKEGIDTSTPEGKFMLTIFAALSQLERQVPNAKKQQVWGFMTFS